MEDQELVSVTEAAGIMGLGRSQVLRLCNSGRINAQKVGNTWIIPRTSAETYTPGPQGFAVVWARRKAKAEEGKA